MMKMFKKKDGDPKKPKAAAKTVKVVKQTKVTLPPAPKKKTGMDAVKDLGKYVSTFGLATEGYNPNPKKKK